ncbi:hypothetical protein HJG60_009010 [Phyllostomus discolor]|uniref:Uncharacterized protein n=1 Tax=Phyllostomus discolor TaxID=89673 RepID=A0A833YQ53_9CHIR|nr:hypothetical protein HJG60_009010 [Phyllostomus discolor]
MKPRKGQEGREGPAGPTAPTPCLSCKGLLPALCWAWCHFIAEDSEAQAGQSPASAQHWPSLSLKPPQLLLPNQTPRSSSLPSLPKASLASSSHSGSLYMPRPLPGPASQEGRRVSGERDKRSSRETSMREQL